MFLQSAAGDNGLMPNDQKTNLLVGCAAGFSGDRWDAAVAVVGGSRSNTRAA
eukprot:gene40233-64092_t